MPEESNTAETPEAAPDYQAEAVGALAGWIAEGEARLNALSPVPGHPRLGMARGSFACALALLRNDLALVGDTH